LALGLAIGRIGCYLNGCCWGQVACETCTVPLGAAHFPLLPGHMRGQLVTEQYLQTSTGFALEPRARTTLFEDPRSRVAVVEPGSPAAEAGVMAGDRITTVNGELNLIIADLSGHEEKINAALALLPAGDMARKTESPTGRSRVEFLELKPYLEWRMQVDSKHLGVDISTSDRLEELARDWPRGKSALSIGVVHADGTEQELTFAPRTIGLYPTQLYETVSMVLLILLLLAYYPFRRHDGQLMVVLMVGYAVHRFINESLRIEPSYSLGLTLSQWGSVVVLAAAIGIEIFLWRTMPSRWRSPPASPGGAPA
jgi:hypothetical protein